MICNEEVAKIIRFLKLGSNVSDEIVERYARRAANAVIHIGDKLKPELAELLHDKLLDGDPRTRYHVAFMLGSIPSKQSAQILGKALRAFENDKSFCAKAFESLVRLDKDGEDVLRSHMAAGRHSEEIASAIVECAETYRVMLPMHRQMLEELAVSLTDPKGREIAINYLVKQSNPPIGKFYDAFKTKSKNLLLSKRLREDMVKAIFSTYLYQNDIYRTFGTSTMSANEKRQVVNRLVTCRELLSKIEAAGGDMGKLASDYLKRLPPYDKNVSTYLDRIGNVGLFKVVSGVVNA